MNNTKIQVEYVERFEFYERAKKCYAVVATGYDRYISDLFYFLFVEKLPNMPTLFCKRE